MPVFFNVAIIVAIAGYAYFQGLSWALKTRRNEVESLHSLPHYYGIYPALTTLIPALFCLLGFMIGDEIYIRNQIATLIPTAISAAPEFSLTIQLAQIKNVADGIIFGEPEQWMLVAGQKWSALQSNINVVASIMAIGLAVSGAIFGQTRMQRNFVRAIK